MNKTLLSAIAACAVCASAGATDWTAAINGIFSSDGAIFAAQSAVANDGSVIVTGAFDTDATIAGNAFEPVGTSAYIVKYNADGTAAWSVALIGSADISCVTTDAEGNIYVAGTYAAEVTIGSTDGKTAEIKGVESWGDYTTEQKASFIARYNAAGALTASTTFVPGDTPGAADAADPAEGFYASDVSFEISNIAVEGGKLYASAAYSGHTAKGDVNFDGTYNDPWFGLAIVDVNAASVFSCDAATLESFESIVACTTQGNLATDESYYVKSVNFTVDGGEVYAVFSGNGPLKYTAASDSKISEATYENYNYAFIDVKDGKFAQFAEYACPPAAMKATAVPAYVVKSGASLYVVGYEQFVENSGEDNERVSDEIFVFKAPADDLAKAQEKFVKENVEGNINYYGISSAALLADGNIALTAYGYYTESREDYDKDAFAGKAVACIYNGTALVPAPVAGATSVAANGASVVYQSISAEGVAITASIDAAGVEGIVADDVNAPVEYFNLQGIRISNPTDGVVIRRQGSNVQKIILK